MENPFKRLAAWILRKELAYYQETAIIQNNTLELLHETNQKLAHMNAGMRIQIQHQHAINRGQIH